MVLGPASGPPEKHLFYIRLGGARFTADGVTVEGRIAPAKNGQTFFASDFFHDAFADQALLFFDRQEHHADAVSAWLGQRESQPGAFACEEFVWNLNENASPVAGFRIAATGAAMGQIDE